MKHFVNDIKKSELYIGQNAGRRIENYIEKAQKSIKIISPYIADEKFNLLVNKSKQNVNVSLLTSADKNHFRNPHESKFLKDVIIQDRHTNAKKIELRKWLLISFLIVLAVVFAFVVIIIMNNTVNEIITNMTSTQFLYAFRTNFKGRFFFS